jgi:tRNA (cmo5U34)-methyltransferase
MGMSEEVRKTVGDGIAAENANWTFSEGVAKTFTSHVRKSVPFYTEGQELVAALSDFYINDSSVVYELGTSTGALIGKLARRHSKKPSRFIGIDIIPEMIDQARIENGDADNIEFVVDDVVNHPYVKSDLIIAYYTVQFVSPYLRQQLIDRIYKNLNWGGAFIMFEKVRAPDARFQDHMSILYNDYKLAQGYSPDEIVAKTRSLKRVLEPFSSGGNLDMLKRAGFLDYMSVMKYVCFEGFLAIK